MAWRLVQQFLSTNGVYEVEVNIPASNRHQRPILRCNCPGWAARGSCKHSLFLLERTRQFEGELIMTFDRRATPVDLAQALESDDSFRAFVTEFGIVEVI